MTRATQRPAGNTCAALLGACSLVRTGKLQMPDPSPNEDERWKQSCLAKATYCEFAANVIGDGQYGQHLKTLAKEWKQEAQRQSQDAARQ